MPLDKILLLSSLLLPSLLSCGEPVDWSQPGVGPSILPEASPNEPWTAPPAQLQADLSGWAVAGCLPPTGAPIAALRGTWRGPITLTQRLDDALYTTTSQTELTLSAQGHPRDQLPGLGWSSPWSVRSVGGLDLTPLWDAGGQGELQVGPGSDGPWTPVRASEGSLCATDRSLEWRVTMSHPWFDALTPSVIPDPEAPLVWLDLHQALAWDQRAGLLLSAVAEGSRDDGVQVSLEASGTLEWLDAGP
ncbi:MAG TPA: hypothetical protein ENK18_11565 [Deltaproteobacteria bacterium]|nr:hypothetical protein [Deltaproteobacteria bacterium]